MKNPDYKSKEQLEKEWAELSEPERNIIKQLSVDLLRFHKKKKHISLENLDTLNGYLDTLTIFIKSYSKRVITLLKQGNKLG
ncbi:MAG TPA: hypothetical protein EYN64_04475 [Flavobacteriales bacterium]|nr:hypothetical protein [Flavobacteriales bacterium]